MKNKVIKEIKLKHGKLTITRNSKKEMIQGAIGWLLTIVAVIVAIKFLKG